MLIPILLSLYLLGVGVLTTVFSQEDMQFELKNDGYSIGDQVVWVISWPFSMSLEALAEIIDFIYDKCRGN